MPVEHFRSKNAEMKNLAYRHLHGIPYTATEAVVGGRKHKVKHSKDPKRKKINAAQKMKKTRRASR
jgi:hypothetical protein